MPIDYSKWDHLDDDSESDQDDANVTGPRVTRLDAATRVTFGGQQESGWSTAQDPARVKDSRDSTAKVQGLVGMSTYDAPSKLSPDTRSMNQWTAKGGSFVTTSDRNRNLYWSQDRYSVYIRVELHPGEAIERVHVDGILPYLDRHCATGSHKHHLSITGSRTSPPDLPSATNQVFNILQGDLPHPVHWSQEDDSEAQTLDWEIQRHPLDFKRRFVSITLHKATPMVGLFVWWKCPLVQFDPPMAGEQNYQDKEIPGNSNAFLDAWEEAHQIFRESQRQQPTMNLM